MLIPYICIAKALATPVRMCALTKTRLPSFFLQDFNLVAHPETDAPWLIPSSLIPDRPSPAQELGAKGIPPAADEASPDGARESVEDTQSEPHNS